MFNLLFIQKMCKRLVDDLWARYRHLVVAFSKLAAYRVLGSGEFAFVHLRDDETEDFSEWNKLSLLDWCYLNPWYITWRKI